MKTAKKVLGLLVILALAVSMVMVAPVFGAPPTFNGDVETDFTGPGVLTFPDPDGQNVLVPTHPVPGTSSGWDIKDVRVTYDPATDILYVGLNSYETVGDADTDGNEGLMTYDSGVDVPNLGSGESVSVYFDLNQDGDWDVIAGVPSASDFSGFTVKSATGSPPGMAFFGANLTTGYDHLGIRYWTPGSAPDLEFEIWNFSHLPNQDGALSAFTIGAFMGSMVDVTITEDWLLGSNGPAAINIVKKTNGTDNNSPTGPYVAVNSTVNWTYEVTNPGSVNLTNIVVIDDNGTPGNTGDDFSPSPVDVSPPDGFNDGDTDMDNELDLTETWLYRASGNATLGQYANSANATGYSDGFNVTDSDPDHYFGSAPLIDVEKHVWDGATWHDADTATGPSLTSAHNPVIFRFVITNNSTFDLTSVNLTDVPAIGTFYTNQNLTNPATFPIPTLATKASVTVYGSLPWAQGQQTDTATATGAPPVGAPVFDSDPANYFGLPPSIDLEKHVWDGATWHDADTAPGPSLASVHNPVIFRFVITNNCSVNLTSVNLTDVPAIGTFYTNQNLTGPAAFPIPTLATNASVTVYGSLPWAQGQQTDTATATGAPPVGAPVFDSDPANYFGLPPSIDLEKHVWDGATWHDADMPPGPFLTPAQNPVIFRFVITNNCSVNLTSVTLSDTDTASFYDDQGLIMPATFPIPTLVTSTSVTVYSSLPWAQGQHSNNATTTGTPPLGALVSDSDPAHYFGRNVTVGWETYPVNKVRVLLPWIALLAAIVAGASLLVLRHRRAQS
ncbi:MAG: hypothetical protein WBH01_01745 [Dehalococcoidia bacterium]